MSKNQTTLSNTHKTGLYIMVTVGKHGFSFFDEGIVEGSGIWHHTMRDEIPVSKALASRGIRWAIKEGYFTEGAEDEVSDEGRWLELTARGAKTALALATENTDWASITETPAEATSTPAKSASAPVASNASNCLCGCGLPTAKTYRPGHDARHASLAARRISTGRSEGLPADQLNAIVDGLPTNALRLKALAQAHRLDAKAAAKNAK